MFLPRAGAHGGGGGALRPAHQVGGGGGWGEGEVIAVMGSVIVKW